MLIVIGKTAPDDKNCEIQTSHIFTLANVQGNNFETWLGFNDGRDNERDATDEP